MRTALAAAILCLLPLGLSRAEDPSPAEKLVAGHMVAEATLAAHYVAAALKAGMGAGEINAVLADIVKRTVISEFWISDETGRVVFTHAPGTDFAFGTDPEADRQSAPFARLLSGEAAVVVQGIRARELDGRKFKYVGVAGVDGRRIVQVGLAAAAVEEGAAPAR